MWVTLSVVFFLLTCMPVSRDSKGRTYFTSAVLTSTVQQPRLRLWRKIKPQDKSAIDITRFTQRFINGSILDLTISVGHPHNGTPKSVKIFSWKSSKKIESRSNRWLSAIVRIVICFLLIGLYVEHVPSVVMKMREVINATNVKNSLTTLLKWRIITALSVRILQF